MSLLDSKPIHLATKFHQAPRFGASNDISNLASDDPEMMLDYIRGVTGCSVLIVIGALVWLVVLMYLKCRGGRKRPSCASGGGVIHIKELREVHHLNRSQRKTIIRRQWRVQGLALFVCALVIPANLVGIQLGLHPFLDGLQDVREVNDQVDSKTYQGIDIGHRLDSFYQNLTHIPFDDSLNVTEMCPKLLQSRRLITPTLPQTNSTSEVSNNTTEILGDILEWKQLITQGLKLIDERFSDINIPTDKLHVVTNATNILDYGLDFVVENDWYLKLGLLVLDVVVLFWCLGILVAQNNVVWLGMQRVAAYFLMPLLLLLLPVLVAAACGLLAMLLLNADFCVGNDSYHSPLGSLSDMIEVLNGDAFDDTLHYYTMNCLAENPLQFLDTMEWEIADALSALEQIELQLHGNLDTFVTACDPSNSTMATLNSTLDGTRTALTGIRGSIVAAEQLTECSSVIPILRRLVYGATCRESIQSLTVMFGCTLAMVIIVLLLLSTRSALFSPIIRGRRNKRRETEFKEYKKYMSQFYQTKEWSVDWVPPDGNELNQEIKRTDTQSTASPTSSDDSEAVVADALVSTPHRTGMFVNSRPIYEEEDEDDDSYDSTYSSESEGDMADSTSMVSGWSRFMEKHRMRPSQSSGLNESYSTTSSIFSDARQRITNLANGQTALSMLASVRDRYSRNQSNIHEESDEDDDQIDDRDSCMMTPEPIRYTSRVSFNSSARKRREDPQDFEMIALSPKQPSFSPARYKKTLDKEKKALSRRHGSYK